MFIVSTFISVVRANCNVWIPIQQIYGDTQRSRIKVFLVPHMERNKEGNFITHPKRRVAVVTMHLIHYAGQPMVHSACTLCSTPSNFTDALWDRSSSAAPPADPIPSLAPCDHSRHVVVSFLNDLVLGGTQVTLATLPNLFAGNRGELGNLLTASPSRPVAICTTIQFPSTRLDPELNASIFVSFTSDEPPQVFMLRGREGGKSQQPPLCFTCGPKSHSEKYTKKRKSGCMHAAHIRRAVDLLHLASALEAGAAADGDEVDEKTTLGQRVVHSLRMYPLLRRDDLKLRSRLMRERRVRDLFPTLCIYPEGSLATSMAGAATQQQQQQQQQHGVDDSAAATAASPRASDSSRARVVVCPKCHGRAELVKVATRAHLFLRSDMYHGLTVYDARCNACSTRICYDGRDDGLINVSNYVLVDATLLYELAAATLHAYPTHAWWTDSYARPLVEELIADDTLADRKLEQLVRLRSYISAALAGFLHLLKLPVNNFCECPSVTGICLDGIEFSTETRRLPDFSSPSYLITEVSTRANPYRRALRTPLLSQFNVATITAALVDLAHKKPVVADPLKAAAAEDPSIHLVSRFLAIDPSDAHRVVLAPSAPNALTEFALTLAWDAAHAFASLNVGQSLDFHHHQALRRSVSAAAHLDAFDAALVQRVVAHILNRARSIFFDSSSGAPLGDLPLADHATRERIKTEPRRDLRDNGRYFPYREVVRQLVEYMKPNSSKPPDEDDDAVSCTKHTRGARKLAPGVVLFSCLCCRKCIGFQVLSNKESPRVVYQTLLTRFEKMPQYVIYDNACNALEYCLNRNPAAFKDTIFAVDAFHMPNHSACAPSFNIKSFQDMHGAISVLHEIKNASIARLKRLAPFWSYPLYSGMLRYAVATLNHHEVKKSI
ncbi:hypothetical protein H9P43_001428 [Blastocladiella emersonii ATCC 22665]|nr:hypothetical protein H9P43_001428 [Blastocladiella emersonii ATCC 22665]